MKTIRVGMLLAVGLYGVPAPAGEAEVPAAAREVVKRIEEETAKIEKKIDGEIQKRRDKTTVELKKLQDLFCKEAKLDEAVAVRDLIRALRDGTNATPGGDLPAAAKEVFKQYEDEVAEIVKKAEADLKKRREQAAGELKRVQDQFCKEAKLDEAVAVRDLIRTIRDGVKVLPDPNTIDNPVTDIGKVFYYEVTGLNQGQMIWGSDVYTTGSHVGMAAVHCGLLNPGQKGIVKVTILPGQIMYFATTRNGVTSQPYGQWDVSFRVERAHGFRRAALGEVAAVDESNTPRL